MIISGENQCFFFKKLQDSKIQKYTLKLDTEDDVSMYLSSLFNDLIICND